MSTRFPIKWCDGKLSPENLSSSLVVCLQPANTNQKLWSVFGALALLSHRRLMLGNRARYKKKQIRFLASPSTTPNLQASKWGLCFWLFNNLASSPDFFGGDLRLGWRFYSLEVRLKGSLDARWGKPFNGNLFSINANCWQVEIDSDRLDRLDRLNGLNDPKAGLRSFLVLDVVCGKFSESFKVN